MKMVTNRLCFIITLIIIVNGISAQTSGFLQGFIRDSLSGEAIPYASILIRYTAHPDSSLGGVSSSGNGHFSFSLPANISVADLQLRISSIGYYSKLVPASMNSIIVNLNKEPVNLKEVLVFAYRQNLKSEVDQITYFVKDDTLMQDKSGLEAVAKMPFVWVTPNQKIEYKYQKKLLFLLNGKYYETFQTSVTSALQSIPAKLIERIELWSDPGPKFRSEYAAAINIVAKGYLHGITANTNLSARYVAKQILPNNSFFMFWQHYNFGIQANVSHTKGYNYMMNDYKVSYLGANASQQNASYQRIERMPGYNADVTLDLDMNKAWSLNLYGAYNQSYLKSNSVGAYTNSDMVKKINFNTVSEVYNRSPRTEAGLMINKSYAVPEHQLSFSARQVWGDSEEATELQQFNDNRLLNTSMTQNLVNNRDLSIEGVYSRPLSARLIWESKANYILRRFVNSFQFDTLNQMNNKWQNNLQSNQDYRQQINKLVQGLKWRSPGLLINLNVNFDISNYSTEEFKKTFWNFYPSLRIRKKAAKNTNDVYELTYRRAIRRPDAQLIGSYFNIQDPLTLNIGNPSLTQRSFHEFSLGKEGIVAKNKVSYFNAFELTFNPKLITNFTRYDSVENRSVVAYEQISNSVDYALIFGFGYQANNQLSFQLSNHLRYVSFQNTQTNQKNSGLFDQLNFVMNATLWKDFNLSTNYTCFSNSPSLQGKETWPSRYFMSIGRSLWKNQGGISIIGHNFLLKNQTKKIVIDEPQFKRTDYNTGLGRIWELSIYYRFGNLEIGGPKPPRRISANDLQGVK